MKKWILFYLLFVTGLATEIHNFEEAEIEDIYTIGCDPGYVTNTDNTCSQCTPGTYVTTDSNHGNRQHCGLCPYDTYSDVGATECRVCGEGLGTLEIASTSAADCVAVCRIPKMHNVARITPEWRVTEGGDVEIVCSEGYYYGNAGSATVSCISSTNNFPASCRKLSISASSPSVKAGVAATLTCSVEASDVGDHSNNHFAIYWIHPTNNDTFRNTIATTMAQMPLEDGVTMVTTSTLSISRFNSGDAGLYSCRVLYDEPIRDEHSAELYLGIVDLVMAPAVKQFVSAGEDLEIYCTMKTDEHYVYRVITWQLNNGDNIHSGVTTSTSNSVHNSILTLSNTALTDSGTYTCTATYSLSDSSDHVTFSESVVVMVRGFEVHPADQIVEVGSGVTLSCAVVGEQPADISWSSPGVSATVHSSAEELTDRTWITFSTLVLTHVVPGHGGDYECSADFGVVLESNSATLIVKEFGIAEDPTSKTYLVGDVAVLTCTVKNSDVPPGTIRWYKQAGGNSEEVDDTRVNFDGRSPLGTSTFTVRSVRSEDAGEYFCEAVYVISDVLVVRRSLPALLQIGCEDRQKNCSKKLSEKKKKRKKCKKSACIRSCPLTCGLCKI